MFRFTEPSSGQFSKQGTGTFSDCAHYGIPYCLQITRILPLKIMLNSVADVLFNSYQHVLVKIFKKVEYYE